MIRLAIGIFLGLATSAMALDLSLPGAAVNRIETNPATSVRLPAASWTAGRSVAETEGAIRRTAYQLTGSTRTTLQLIEPARTSLEEEGYEAVFACSDAACGGFDFRYQLDLLPEPDMHVDLGDFRYLLMEKEGGNPRMVSLVASAAASAGFLHVTEVFDAVFPENSVTEVPETPVVKGDLVSTLESIGHVVLDDLEFQTGSTDLGEGPYASLSGLATWLAANPSARVVLVGHTDAVGSLEANTSLSERRAGAVVERLVTGFDVNREQVQSAGAGYLSPIASNLSEAGRAANRRVEVVLLSRE